MQAGTTVDETIAFTKANRKALPANSVVTWKRDLTVRSDGSY